MRREQFEAYVVKTNSSAFHTVKELDLSKGKEIAAIYVECTKKVIDVLFPLDEVEVVEPAKTVKGAAKSTKKAKSVKK